MHTFFYTFFRRFGRFSALFGGQTPWMANNKSCNCKELSKSVRQVQFRPRTPELASRVKKSLELPEERKLVQKPGEEKHKIGTESPFYSAHVHFVTFSAFIKEPNLPSCSFNYYLWNNASNSLVVYFAYTLYCSIFFFISSEILHKFQNKNSILGLSFPNWYVTFLRLQN